MTFTRAIGKLSILALDDLPVGSVSRMSIELAACLLSLFLTSTFYGVIGFFWTIKNHSRIFNIEDSNKSPANITAAVARHALAESSFVGSILNSLSMENHSLVVSDLAKTYNLDSHTKVHALKRVSFRIDKGEIFGLLGPNGAGKTTLIGIITGLHNADYGAAFVEGLNVSSSLEDIYKMIGVCPQFDCLWSDLTVEEHFLFYVRIRGMPVNLEQIAVAETLSKMRLTASAKKKIDELSGGMKRRVSIGIAIAGSTKLVILDEPTTGLDPINRIQIWQIVKEIKQQNAVLLTTHLMEEADQLCDRIGIINHGELLCVDYNHNLKKKFGNGYTLIFIFDEQINDDSKNQLLRFVIDYDINATIQSKSQRSIAIRMDLEEAKLVEFCSHLETQKDKFHLHSWSLSQSNLNDVFINVIKYNRGCLLN